MPHTWTKEDEAFLVANYSKLTVRELSEIYGVSPKAITRRMYVLRHRGKKAVRKAVRYRKVADREIVRDGYPDVPWWCRQSTRCQFFAPNMYREEEKTIAPRKSVANAAMILYAEGVDCLEIANRLGVGRSAVYHIVNAYDRFA